MYAQLDFVGLAEGAAAAVIRRERERYAVLLTTGDRFVAERRLVFGGDAAARLLLGLPPDPQELLRKIYVMRDAFEIARALADALFASGPEGRYTQLTTVTPHENILITVDGTKMYRVQRLPRYRGATAFEAVRPVLRPSHHVPGLSVACLGPEIQLGELYKMLCDPAFVARWPEIVRQESALRLQLLSVMKKRLLVAGGRRRSAPSPSVVALRQYILDHEEHVVVGPWALGDRTRRLQIIPTRPVKDVVADLTQRARALSIPITAASNDPLLPGDEKLRRVTVYVRGGPAQQQQLVDMFNLAEYSLVPFAAGRKDGVRRQGTPPLVLRMQIADLWTVILLHRLSRLTRATLDQLIAQIGADIRRVGDALTRALENDADGVLPTSSGRYFGHWLDAELAEKRTAFEARLTRDRRFYPYAPALNKDNAKGQH